MTIATFNIDRTHYNALLAVVKTVNVARPLDMIHVRISATGEAYAEASDGHRAIRVPIVSLDDGPADHSFQIPHGTKAAPKRAGETLTCEISDTAIKIGALVTFSRAAAEFPDVDRVTPKATDPRDGKVQLCFNPLLVVDVQKALDASHVRVTDTAEGSAYLVEFSDLPEVLFRLMPCRF